jgi:hypothetical protein
MIRNTILWLALGLAAGQLSQAQTEVQYTAGSGERNVVQADGTTVVPNGNYVEVGYFDSNAGFNPSTSSTDLLALDAHWHQFGFTNIETFAPFGPPVGGRFRGDDVLNDPSFDNQKIYLWIFDTTGNGAPAGDFSNVTEYGLFSSTASNWQFPVDGTPNPGNLTTVSSSDVNQFIFGGSVAGSPGSLELATTVPEPSSLSLVAVGLLLAHRMRRPKRCVLRC